MAAPKKPVKKRASPAASRAKKAAAKPQDNVLVTYLVVAFAALSILFAVVACAYYYW